MSCYLNSFKQAFNFKDCASRTEYWTFFAFDFVIASILLFMAPFVFFLYDVIMIFPRLSYIVRRLHDSNKTGAFAFLLAVPFVGWIILIVLLTIDTNSIDNRYRKDEVPIDAYIPYDIDVKRCSCGERLNYGVKFCPNCGMDSSMKHTCSCGKEVKANVAFCDNCGKEIKIG